MATLTIPAKSKAINALLKKARRKNLILQSAEGDKYVLCRIGKARSFQVGNDDDFAQEVEKTRKNKKLMKFLDERDAKAKGKKGIPIEQVRREPGL